MQKIIRKPRYCIFLILFLFLIFGALAAGDDSYVFDTKWGTSGSGDGQFSSFKGVAVDSSGNVYVADTFNHRIQKFSSTGTFLLKWGSSGSGDGQFNRPWDVTVDSSGNVYVTDSENWRIQKFSSTGTFLAKWGGTYGTADGEFKYPFGVAVDSSGNVYVADVNNFRIQKFSSTGTFLSKWGSEGSGDGQFNNAEYVAVDSSGNVYVSDCANFRIQKFSSTGTFLSKWGSEGSGDGQFSRPEGITVDSSGNVFITENGGVNNRVQKFSSTGTFLAKWGSEGSGDGQFSSAYDVAVDSSDKVYIVDTGNYRIQKFSLSSPNPTITSITPDNGVNTGTVSITNLAGTGFLAGATVKLTKTGQADISATGVTIDSATKITCTLDLTGAAPGTWNVVVTNTDTKTGTLTNGFTVNNPAPTITSITPDNGVNTGTVSITNLAGTGFLAGATVKLTKAGQADISATGVTIDSATKITCTFDLSGAAAGTWNVVVTNTDTKTGTLTYGFTVYNPAPTITSITPNNGVNTGTISITNLAGTGFLAGATVKLTKAGQSDISATGVTVDSATKITCTFDLSGAAAGSWFVEVMNPGSLTGVVNLFTVISSGSSTSLGSSSSDSDYSPPVAVISAAERAAKDAADKAAKDAAAKEANEKAAKEAADKVAANKAIRDALEKEYRDAIEKGRQESEAQAAAQKASISDIYLASKNNANPNGKQDVVQQQKESVISNARTVNSIFDFLIVNSARALDNLPVAADILQPLSPEFKMGYAAVTEYQPQPQLSFALDQYQLITDVINDKPSSVIQEDIAKSLISGSLLFVPAEPGGILSRLLDASKYIGFAENYQESIFWK